MEGSATMHSCSGSALLKPKGSIYITDIIATEAYYDIVNRY